MKRVVVIGGGAAGLMAAGTAAKNGSTVTLIEKNERPARKLMITGKGRCNVTNNCDRDTFIASVPRNGRFLYSAFSQFSAADTMLFFEQLGVPLKTERGNRVFPVSDKSSDIVDALVRFAKKQGVSILCDEVKETVVSDGSVTGVLTASGEILPAESVIIATGGLSYPVTGSTGDGFKMAEKLGHTVSELRGSLVPLEIHEGFCSKIAGLSLRNVTFSVYEADKKKPIFSEFGELLFTHFGLSGPLVLSASAHIGDIRKKDYYAKIDLKPALTNEQLDKRILRDFSEELNKDFANALAGLLPRSLIPVVISLSDIPARTKVNQISRAERERLVALLKGLTVGITGFRPTEEAIITRGGVSVKEINPATMRSRLIDGLLFAGEIIDTDAYTGGFNLQIAFSTGYLAGMNV